MLKRAWRTSSPRPLICQADALIHATLEPNVTSKLHFQARHLRCAAGNAPFVLPWGQICIFKGGFFLVFVPCQSVLIFPACFIHSDFSPPLCQGQHWQMPAGGTWGVRKKGKHSTLLSPLLAPVKVRPLPVIELFLCKICPLYLPRLPLQGGMCI